MAINYEKEQKMFMQRLIIPHDNQPTKYDVSEMLVKVIDGTGDTDSVIQVLNPESKQKTYAHLIPLDFGQECICSDGVVRLSALAPNYRCQLINAHCYRDAETMEWIKDVDVFYFFNWSYSEESYKVFLENIQRYQNGKIISAQRELNYWASQKKIIVQLQKVIQST